MKMICVLAAMLAGSAACAADNATVGDSPQAPNRTYGQNYKDMQLATCIAIAYEKDAKASKDAGNSAGVLIEWTYYDAEHGPTESDNLITRYLNRDYHNPLVEYQGVKFDMLKCLDMYHSKELDALVKRYVLKPNRTYKQDYPNR